VPSSWQAGWLERGGRLKLVRCGRVLKGGRSVCRTAAWRLGLPEQSPQPSTSRLADDSSPDALADPAFLDRAHVAHQACERVREPCGSP